MLKHLISNMSPNVILVTFNIYFDNRNKISNVTSIASDSRFVNIYTLVPFKLPSLIVNC